jgi:hypothetical protein
VTVPVDHRVVQARTDLCRRLMAMGAHVRSSPGQPLMPLVVAPDARIVQARHPTKAIVLAARAIDAEGGLGNVALCRGHQFSSPLSGECVQPSRAPEGLAA